jgi:hypothetical protein
MYVRQGVNMYVFTLFLMKVQKTWTIHKTHSDARTHAHTRTHTQNDLIGDKGSARNDKNLQPISQEKEFPVITKGNKKRYTRISIILSNKV